MSLPPNSEPPAPFFEQCEHPGCVQRALYSIATTRNGRWPCACPDHVAAMRKSYPVFRIKDGAQMP